MKNHRFLTLSALFMFCLLAACAPSPVGSYQASVAPDRVLLAENTRKTIAYEGPLRNPVILIHGFLGARLTDSMTGKEVWGTFRPGNPSDEDLRNLAHPMAWGRPLASLRNDVRADELLDTVNIRIMGFPLSMEGYRPFVSILEEAGYPAEGNPLPPGKHFHTQFHYYYDWRRDISENVLLFHKFLMEKRALLQKEYERVYGLKDYDVRFDVLAHSMGGLLGKYYLRHGPVPLPENPDTLLPVTRAGERYIDKFIQLGTPNAGYLDTVLELTSGLQLAPGAPLYPPGLLGTFPSAYQMLPYPELHAVLANGEDVDLYDAATWKKYNWGLASSESDEVLRVLLPDVQTRNARQNVALDHLRKCLSRAKQLMRTLSADDPSTEPHITQWILFYGDAIPTTTHASVDASGRISVTTYDAGDGKIPAVSCRFDLRDPQDKFFSPFMASNMPWTTIVSVRGAHMGFANAPEFGHNVRLYLLQMPTPRQRAAETALRDILKTDKSGKK